MKKNINSSQHFTDETKKIVNNCRKRDENLKSHRQPRFKKSLRNSNFLKNYFEFESGDHSRDQLTVYKMRNQNSNSGNNNHSNIVRKKIVNISKNSNSIPEASNNESFTSINTNVFNYQNNIMMIFSNLFNSSLQLPNVEDDDCQSFLSSLSF